MVPSPDVEPVAGPSPAAHSLVPTAVVDAILTRPDAWHPWTAKAMVDLVDRVARWAADPQTIDSLTYVPWEQIGMGVDLTGSAVRPSRLPGLRPHEAQAAWDRIVQTLVPTANGWRWLTAIGRRLGGRPAPVVQAALDRLPLDQPVTRRAARSAVIAALAEHARGTRTGAVIADGSHHLTHPHVELLVEETLRWAEPTLTEVRREKEAEGRDAS